MGEFLDYVLLLLRQFGGGPGPVENNLVRFGLAAILWAILFMIAWSRQRFQELPREKLLVWGFGLAFLSEIYMFSLTSWKIISGSASENTCIVIEPIEHALAMIAIIVTAGAFLRYTLDDKKISHRYILIGVGIAILGLLYASWSWPRQLAAAPGFKFHQTWIAWLFHLPLSVMIVVAIFLLRKKSGWLRNTVSVALGFYFMSEFLFLLNYSTQRTYANFLCPIGNCFHILAIPLLGYVYLREQSLEKRQADQDLKAYRDHLEELVTERTAELSAVNASFNEQLQLAAMLKERQRIAADMHDGLAQTLGLLGLHVDQANELVVDGMNLEAIEVFDDIREVVAHAFTEVRSSISNLNDPPQPRLPLQDSLRSLFAQFSKGNSISLEFVDKIQGEPFLPNEISSQVLPIVQESLINICRHAQAKNIRVIVEQSGHEVEILIEDDGCGFDVDAPRRDNGHFGLSIMQARAERIRGKLHVYSKPGQGTRVSLRLPLTTEGENENRDGIIELAAQN